MMNIYNMDWGNESVVSNVHLILWGQKDTLKICSQENLYSGLSKFTSVCTETSKEVENHSNNVEIQQKGDLISHIWATLKCEKEESIRGKYSKLVKRKFIQISCLESPK